MSKLRTYLPLLLFVCMQVFLSCEKLEIPNDEYASNTEKEGDTNTEKNGEDEGDEPPAIEAYSVSDIRNERFTNTEDVYVVGYIVGYVKTSNMDFCRFSRGDVETNIVIADTPIETLPDKCIPVQLSTANIPCTETRTALNLAKNDVLGQKVRLQGDIGKYMGTYGLLKARNHTFLENDFDEDEYEKENEKADNETGNNEDDNASENGDGTQDEPEDDNTTNDYPDAPDNGEGEQDDDNTTDDQQWADLERYIHSHGTEDAPFTIMDFKTTLPEYLNHYGASEIGHAGMKDVYICGYIVGFIPKGYSTMEKTIFSSEGASQTNIVLADSPDEQDWENCIPVQLSTSSERHKEVRDALNLANHPENYKQRFIIFGNISVENGYMGTRGLESARKYIPCDD